MIYQVRNIDILSEKQESKHFPPIQPVPVVLLLAYLSIKKSGFHGFIKQYVDYQVIFDLHRSKLLNTTYNMKRSATATWTGSGKEGKGTMTTKSGILNTDRYGFRTRFEDEPGTNPEELIAAAHAGCFSMKLSFVLGEAGFTPSQIDTKCSITIEAGSITHSQLEVSASVPGIDDAKFQECAQKAKAECPVSKVLNADISISATLK